jgi:dTDP-4-dehydrorhamnose reductase
MRRLLFYGHTGFIGSRLYSLLDRKEFEVIPAKSRLDDYSSLINEIESYSYDRKGIDYVLNCAGITGRPNIDWCEDNKAKTLQVNVIGTSILADLCYRKNIHYTYIGTGCIYDYTEEFIKNPRFLDTFPGYRETDKPNFDKSFYSFSKILIENITKSYPNSLILRVRMPISDDFNPRSFITKIVGYKKVINVPNSMTVLHDCLPLVPTMIQMRLTGIYNFVNPGVISHHQILDLYREYINPSFSYTPCRIEEQDIKAPRSNNKLCTDKIRSLFDIPDINVSIHEVFRRMKHDITML